MKPAITSPAELFKLQAAVAEIIDPEAMTLAGALRAERYGDALAKAAAVLNEIARRVPGFIG